MNKKVIDRFIGSKWHSIWVRKGRKSPKFPSSNFVGQGLWPSSTSHRHIHDSYKWSVESTPKNALSKSRLWATSTGSSYLLQIVETLCRWSTAAHQTGPNMTLKQWPEKIKMTRTINIVKLSKTFKIFPYIGVFYEPQLQHIE